MARADVVIVDYGMANLRSVQKAFERVGHAAEVTSDPRRVADARKLVLPGVGAFRDAIARLRETGLADTISAHVRADRPFLGICLGLQLLFSRSQEDGVHAGLGLYRGEVDRFQERPGLKIPHMGWNSLHLTRPDCPLFRGLPPNPAVYFVHSFYPTPDDASLTAAAAEYPEPFCAAVWQGNVFATQFHPEKSQEIGLAMLHNFASL
jgi:glutamine amidotransferase